MSRRRSMMQAAAGALALWLLACNGDRAREQQQAAGAALGTALLRGLQAATARAEPWPCAADAEPLPAAPAGWQIRGDAWVSAPAHQEAAVVVVGDAGGASEPSLAHLREVAKLAVEHGAEVVVSLGGLATSEDELVAALRALSAPQYLLWAAPGDLEALPAHRAAVERLARDGVRVADASRVRALELGAATLAALPGARQREQLGAGIEGCAFGDGDAEALVRRLAAGSGARVLVSWTAPRPAAPSQALGDLYLRQLLEQHEVALAVAGEPTSERAQPDGSGHAGDPLRVLDAGFVDGEPRLPADGARPQASALLLQLAQARWRWQHLPLSMQPSR